MKLQVADLVVRTRNVELPDECPHCQKALGPTDFIVGHLKLFYVDTKEAEPGVLLPDEECEWATDFGPYTPCTYVCCGHCSTELACGKERTIELPSEETTQRVVWSSALDQVMFTKPRPLTEEQPTNPEGSVYDE